MMRFADQFWVSDNTDPFDRLVIQEGYSYVYSPKTMACWVTDSPHFINRRATTLRYRFHSASMGVLGIGGDLMAWSKSDMETAAEMISTYKEIRPIVQNGDLYRLHSPREGDVAAVQYVDRERTESVLFAFLHSQRRGESKPAIRLRGLDPPSLYCVEGAGGKQSGDGLMKIGVTVPFKGDFGSALVGIGRV
jgi:alpha-galactosidase